MLNCFKTRQAKYFKRLRTTKKAVQLEKSIAKKIDDF